MGSRRAFVLGLLCVLSTWLSGRMVVDGQTVVNNSTQLMNKTVPTTSKTNTTTKMMPVTTEDPLSPEDRKILERWQSMKPKMERLVKDALKRLLPEMLKHSSEVQISGACTRSLLKVIAGLRKLKWEAMFLLDASGKPPPGIFAGRLSSFGEYEQCVNLEYPEDQHKMLFQGSYCTLLMRPPLPERPPFHPANTALPLFKEFIKNNTFYSGVAKQAHYFYFNAFRYGICVPSTCSIQDVRNMIKPLEDMFVSDLEVTRCETKNLFEARSEQLVVVFVLGVLVLTVALGTALDIWDLYDTRPKLLKYNPSLIKKFLLAFSLYSNGKIVLNTDMAEDTLSFLPGIRFLSVSWIVLGHNYLNYNFQQMRNLMAGLDKVKNSFLFQIIINGSVSVDSFFFLSGLLVCLTVLKLTQKSKNKMLNVPMFILRRMWRLLPGSMAILGIMLLIPWFGSGPMWHETIDPLMENCRKNWWTNLLFINNIFRNEQACMLHSWFIAADFQLHVSSLLVLLPLIRWPKIGLAINFSFILASILITMGVHLVKSFPPTMLLLYPDPRDMMDLWKSVYFQPWSHAGPYYVGMFVGYLIATNKVSRIPLGLRVIGWIVAISGNMIALFITYYWNIGNIPSLIPSLLYASCHRTLWSIGLGWMTICCVCGHEGFITKFLSWKFFVPLSRLVFMIYLIHYPLMIVFDSMLYEFHFDHRLLIWWYFGHFTISTLLALPACLILESPFIKLEKLLLGTRAQNSEKKENLSDKVLISSDNLIVTKQQELPGLVHRTGGYENGSFSSHL